MDEQPGNDQTEGKRAKLPRWSWVFLLPALLYGLLSRFVFQSGSAANDTLQTMSLGFLGLVPVGIGALTVFARHRATGHVGFKDALGSPLLPSAVFLGTMLLFNIEAAICLVMLAPLYFALPIIGGVLMMIALRVINHYRINDRSSYSVLALLLIAPFVIGSLERGSSPPESLRFVEAQVVIQANADVVWNRITSVPEIRPDEHSLSIFQVIGMPRPQQASLPIVEVGAVRHSSWEGGVEFVETITDFEPNHFLDFSMGLDPEADAPEPFSEIGGRYFDVIGGGYRIEPIGENQVILYLHSTHRLTTRINAYGGLWTDLIMWDLQRYILNIVKVRAESENQ